MTNLNEMKRMDLVKLAGDLNIVGRWELNKQELIDAITAATAKPEENIEKEVEVTMTENESASTTPVLMIEAPEQHLLLTAAVEIHEEAPIIETPESQVVTETHEVRHHGRTKTIEVYKDGKLVIAIEGLLETFKWATENKVCNVGWVKESLKTGRETVPGRKFKQGGYKFVYAS